MSTSKTQNWSRIDGKKTYEASLEVLNHTLRVEGKKYNLGICINYEDYFGGDVEYYTYSVGDMEVEVKIDRQKEQGTLYRIQISDQGGDQE
jgi:hypothetical protein